MVDVRASLQCHQVMRCGVEDEAIVRILLAAEVAITSSFWRDCFSGCSLRFGNQQSGPHLPFRHRHLLHLAGKEKSFGQLQLADGERGDGEPLPLCV